jgi:hypothetical protein
MVVEVENSDAVLTSFGAGRSRRMGERGPSREPMGKSGDASVEKTELLIHDGPRESEKVTMVSALPQLRVFTVVAKVFQPAFKSGGGGPQRSALHRTRKRAVHRTAHEAAGTTSSGTAHEVLHLMAKRTRDEAYAPASPRDEAAGAWNTGGAGGGPWSMVMDIGAGAEGVYGHLGGEVEQLKSRASVKRVKRRVVRYVQTLLTRFFTAGRLPTPMDEEES